MSDLRDMSKNELVREVRRLRILLDQQMSAAPGVGDEVTVQGIISSRDRQPLVDMRAGEATWQMTPEKARKHALLVLDAAVEAERDAATMAFLRGVALEGGDDEESAEQAAAAFLFGMREHRQDWFSEDT